jgi:DNA-binding GntR family transcriptional regulator
MSLMSSSAAAQGAVPLAIEATVGPRTLADRAFITLRDAIVTARLAPGQRLRLDDVAQQLNMSAMPVREALRRLEAASLVEFEPHRGATVARLSVAELTEVFELRSMVETAAIRRSSAQYTEADRQLAEQELGTYQAMLRSGDFGAATEHHQRYHSALYQANQYPWLVRTVMPLWEASGRYWHWLTAYAGWKHDDTEADHRALLELVAAHDVDGAAAALRGHLAQSCDLLTRALAEAGDPASVSR